MEMKVRVVGDVVPNVPILSQNTHSPGPPAPHSDLFVHGVCQLGTLEPNDLKWEERKVTGSEPVKNPAGQFSFTCTCSWQKQLVLTPDTTIFSVAGWMVGIQL